MAKGKKNALRTEQTPGETAENPGNLQAEAKENKPRTKWLKERMLGGPAEPLLARPQAVAYFASMECVGKGQLVLQSLRSQGKPRSPLSDSMLIQEGNDSDAANPGPSKLKQDKTNKTKSESCSSKEQNPEGPCQSETKKKGTDESKQEEESSAKSDDRPAAGPEAPAAKPQSKTGRKLGAKKVQNKTLQNRKVTDYFPIRRSNRKTKTELKIKVLFKNQSEEHRHIDDLLKNDTEEGMEVKQIEGKGRGVFAVKSFKKGDFVVEYHGDLLDLAEAKKREAQYAEDPKTGCYMYYFQYQSKAYCIDATKETGRLGRLVNHSKTETVRRGSTPSMGRLV